MDNTILVFFNTRMDIAIWSPRWNLSELVTVVYTKEVKTTPISRTIVVPTLSQLFSQWKYRLNQQVVMMEFSAFYKIFFSLFHSLIYLGDRKFCTGFRVYVDQVSYWLHNSEFMLPWNLRVSHCSQLALCRLLLLFWLVCKSHFLA